MAWRIITPPKGGDELVTQFQGVPSKMRTAVAKSLTLRAALRAAATTEGEGTRS